MSPRLRVLLLGLAALVLAPCALAVIAAMPEFGTAIAPYGARINAVAPAERNIANMVTAINFDLRGLDTLGEEFMLLAAVTGTVVLLRGRRGERDGDRAARLPGRAVVPRSEAVILACRTAGPLTALFGLYVTVHASLTPGGGFQGGAVLASACVLIYLGEGYAGWRRGVRSAVLDAIEGGGALLVVLCGLGPMLVGAAFMQNVLPFGTFGALLSGGLVLVANLGVAAAVTAGFSQLVLEFLEETRAPRPDGADGGDDA